MSGYGRPGLLRKGRLREGFKVQISEQLPSQKEEAQEVICPVCDSGAPLEWLDDPGSSWLYARGKGRTEIAVCSESCKLLFEGSN